MTMNKTNLTHDELREKAHAQLDNLFKHTFPQHLFKVSGMEVSINQIYDSNELGVFQMVWDIAIEPKPEDIESKRELEKRQRETQIKILKEAGYYVGEAEYQEGYQLAIMVDAVIYPPDGDGYQDHEVYANNNKYLTLDEQWDLAWKHYHSS